MKTNIESFLKEYKDWSEVSGELVANFKLKDFDQVKDIVSKIMNFAEAADHHPTVIFSYNTIEVRTVTHDAGDVITEKDVALAKEISKIV